MKIYILILLPVFLFARVHYAKVEPFESTILKSSASGLVVKADYNLEATVVNGKQIIQIDDKLDKLNLDSSEKTLIRLGKTISINIEIAESLEQTAVRREYFYDRLSKLKTASKTQQDDAYSSFASAKTQHLNILEKLTNIKIQMFNMEYKIEQLKDSISKKSVTLKNKYLYRLMVKEGDFVANGSALMRVDDISKAKITLFLDSEEMVNLDAKTIFIDDKKTSYKIDRLWKVSDEKFISSYRTEIYIKSPKKLFSKLIKVEIK